MLWQITAQGDSRFGREIDKLALMMKMMVVMLVVAMMILNFDNYTNNVDDDVDLGLNCASRYLKV